MKLTYAAMIIGIGIGAVLCAPAQAQYHYNYGDSRVVNQNQTGLYTPSSTYIGAGTLSRSAQGKSAGVGAELPAVNMGSHIRTAGDNLYNGGQCEREENGAVIYRDEATRRNDQRWQRYYAQQRLLQRQNQPQMQKQGHFYVPGSNGAAAGYGSTPTYHTQGGTATYDNPTSQGAGPRNF
jgi:hypothetical protein